MAWIASSWNQPRALCRTTKIIRILVSKSSRVSIHKFVLLSTYQTIIWHCRYLFCDHHIEGEFDLEHNASKQIQQINACTNLTLAFGGSNSLSLFHTHKWKIVYWNRLTVFMQVLLLSVYNIGKCYDNENSNLIGTSFILLVVNTGFRKSL